MPATPVSSLRIRSALLADYAKVERSGLLSIVGGGITEVHLTSVPNLLGLAVVTQLLPAEEIAGTITVEVRRPTGDSALTINGEYSLAAADRLVNHAFNLNLLIDALGEWMVSIAFGDGQPAVDLPFNVAAGQGRSDQCPSRNPDPDPSTPATSATDVGRRGSPMPCASRSTLRPTTDVVSSLSRPRTGLTGFLSSDEGRGPRDDLRVR